MSQSATNVTDTTATLNASINPSGFATTCEFQYVSDAAFQVSGYTTATSVDCSPFDLGSSFDADHEREPDRPHAGTTVSLPGGRDECGGTTR